MGRPLSFFVIVSVLLSSLPQVPLRAAMVTTEAVIGTPLASPSGHARLRAFLAREDVRAQIEAFGIDPEEAIARVDALSDAEVARIAGRLNELPAGGGSHAFVGPVIALVLLLPLALIVGLACEKSDEDCETVDEDTSKDDPFKYDPSKDGPSKDGPSGR